MTTEVKSHTEKKYYLRSHTPIQSCERHAHAHTRAHTPLNYGTKWKTHRSFLILKQLLCILYVNYHNTCITQCLLQRNKEKWCLKSAFPQKANLVGKKYDCRKGILQLGTKYMVLISPEGVVISSFDQRTLTPTSRRSM